MITFLNLKTSSHCIKISEDGQLTDVKIRIEDAVSEKTCDETLKNIKVKINNFFTTIFLEFLKYVCMCLSFLVSSGVDV